MSRKKKATLVVTKVCITVAWAGLLVWHAMQGRLVAYSDELYYHCIMMVLFATVAVLWWRNRRRAKSLQTSPP